MAVEEEAGEAALVGIAVAAVVAEAMAEIAEAQAAADATTASHGGK